MGRAAHSHLIASEVPREYDVWDDALRQNGKEMDTEITAICGEKTRGRWNNRRSHYNSFHDDAKHITCPKCNKKIAQQAIKARPAEAPALTCEADPEARGGFRRKQGWKVLIGGEAIGYVGFEEHEWRIYPLQIESYDERAKRDGPYIRNTNGVLGKDGAVGTKSYGSWRLPGDALGFKSKEAAMLGCEAQFDAGVLKTGPQLFAARAAAQAAAAAAQAVRARQQSSKAERRADTLAALREILERETLTNFQRMGLVNAIEDLERKDLSDIPMIADLSRTG